MEMFGDGGAISVQNLSVGEPGSADAVFAVGRALNFEFPPGYIDFISCWNGVEGFLKDLFSGRDGYVVIYPIECLLEENTDELSSPRFVKFGSNGSGEGFFFDRATKEVVERPIIGDDEDALKVGATFEGFLRYVSKGGLAEYPESLSSE